MALNTVKNENFTTFHTILQIARACPQNVIDRCTKGYTVVPQVVISYGTGHTLSL